MTFKRRLMNVNKTLDKKSISNLIDISYRKAGLKDTVIFADQLMYQGYEYSTKSGSSICVDDCLIPDDKAEIIEKSEQEVKDIEAQYSSGLVTQGEKYNKVIDIWSRANEKVANSLMDTISTEKVTNKEGEEVDIFLNYFNHDKKRLHYRLEMIEKSSKKLSATIELLSLYVNLKERKVSEFENEKVNLMKKFINENENNFNKENLKFLSKLKK